MKVIITVTETATGSDESKFTAEIPAMTGPSIRDAVRNFWISEDEDSQGNPLAYDLKLVSFAHKISEHSGEQRGAYILLWTDSYFGEQFVVGTVYVVR